MKADKRKEKIRALSDGSNFHYAANSTKSKLIIHEKGMFSTIKFIIFLPRCRNTISEWIRNSMPMIRRAYEFFKTQG